MARLAPAIATLLIALGLATGQTGGASGAQATAAGDPAKGRALFLAKGCIACHKVNGVGGRLGPSLDAANMPASMSALDFAARMWRGAVQMVEMQHDLLDGQIELTGEDLANLVAFARDSEAQKTLSREHVPERYRKLISN